MSKPAKIERTYTAFGGLSRIGSGGIEDVALSARAWVAAGIDRPVLVFEDRSGEPIDLDLRGEAAEVLARLASHPILAPEAEPPRAGPGRPRLGVVSREVSLLPRHWAWLAQQPRSASATLRSLVEARMKAGADGDRAREAQAAAYRFMSAMAGDLPGFEEASRALFAGDAEQLDRMMAQWPEDIRAHVGDLARR